MFDDPEEDLNPHNVADESNAAEMNMSFFVYILKDMLDFTGILPQKEFL
jgi:hypothetical protein